MRNVVKLMVTKSVLKVWTQYQRQVSVRWLSQKHLVIALDIEQEKTTLRKPGSVSVFDRCIAVNFP